MSKEQETLEKLISFAFVMGENMVGLTKGNYDEATFIKKTYEYLHKYYVSAQSGLELEKALERLEVIDNTKPSKVMKCLERMWCDLPQYYEEEFNIIKQALIKAQKQEKILNIILKKQVDIEFLKSADTVDEYNTLIETTGFLSDPVTQEEFDLLKEYSKTIEMQKEMLK